MHNVELTSIQWCTQTDDYCYDKVIWARIILTKLDVM